MAGTIREKNIEVLRKRFPEIADYMENPPEDAGTVEEEADLTVGTEDVAGKTVLYAVRKEKMYRMDSLYDSDPMLDLWYKGLGTEWDLNNKLFMYGLGNGLYARKFIRSAREDCRMIIQEPSYKILKTVLEKFDITDVLADDRIRLVFWPLYSNGTVMSYYQDVMEYTDVYSYKGSVYLNYPELFPQGAADYAKGLLRARDFAGANQLVTERFGGYFTRNTFNNFAFLRESMDIVKLAELVPAGIPAIVVAAGPSLDKNIREIAKAKGKCIIISTDTALKPLSLAGIVPDIAAIMDGKKDDRYMSENDSRKIPLVCTPRCGTDFLHLHTGIKFFTDDFCNHINSFMDSVNLKLYKLPSGGSVANVCFSIARMFHCSTIIMMGQDLAYTGDKTHSHVTVRGSVKTEIEDLEHVLMDTDINGDPIRTSQEFRLYREWFEKQIAEDPGLTVIDATEGGVRIAGTELMTAEDAIAKYCTDDFDFGSIISKAVPLFDEETKQKYDDFIRKIPQQMRDLRRMIGETTADYRSMRSLVEKNNYHNQQMKRLYDNCQKQTKRIESSPVIEYVHNQLQKKTSDLLENVNKLEKDEKQELLAVCDMGEKYLRDMDEAITELEPYIEVVKKEFG